MMRTSCKHQSHLLQRTPHYCSNGYTIGFGNNSFLSPHESTQNAEHPVGGNIKSPEGIRAKLNRHWQITGISLRYEIQNLKRQAYRKIPYPVNLLVKNQAGGGLWVKKQHSEHQGTAEGWPSSWQNKQTALSECNQCLFLSADNQLWWCVSLVCPARPTATARQRTVYFIMCCFLSRLRRPSTIV